MRRQGTTHGVCCCRPDVLGTRPLQVAVVHGRMVVSLAPHSPAQRAVLEPPGVSVKR